MRKVYQVLLERIQKEAEIAVRQGVTQLILSDKELSSKNLPMPMFDVLELLILF